MRRRMRKLSQSPRDRVGLAWRDELAVDIHIHLQDIDCLEILADREFRASRKRIAALRELARQVPLSLHSVALGLASSEPVDERRLARIAELASRIEPDHWSEHLAFVRAGGFEIGHLAAAPYRPETLEGALRNVETARRAVGSLPHLENIATIIRPPGSMWSEEHFVGQVLQGTSAPLLLDLHNLYANAWNFGRDPIELLRALPLEQVRSVHLSGGCVVRDAAGVARLVDDHLHDPPDVVFDLLQVLAANTTCGLTVILERDGRFPDFSAVLRQLALARAALARGRERQPLSRSAAA
jgi:uncharacterized protein (UPF0276 family)